MICFKNGIMSGKFKFFLVLFIFFSSHLSYSQKGFKIKSDTLNSEKYGFFSIPEIDYEIERINNYLNTTSQIIDKMNLQLDGDTAYIFLLNQIKLESERFNSYKEISLSNFFLENSHRIWSSYKKSLAVIKNRSFDLLTKSEERNSSLEKQEKTWKKTSENSKELNIPEVQIKKIRKIQTRINKQHNENYKISLRIINHEGVFTEQFNYVNSMLSKIERLQDKHKEELFRISASPIWRINLSDSTNRNFLESLDQAWKDNSKSVSSNYQIYRSQLNDYLLYVIILFAFHFLLMKRFIIKFGKSKTENAGDTKYIILYSPITAYFSTAILLFYVVFENIPLALSNTISLILLVVLYFTVKDYLKKPGQQIIIVFMVLMVLNILEIVIWYSGDFSRIYLFIETLVGIGLTYRFISPKFSREVLPHIRFSKVFSILRFPIFFLIAIAFLANIVGYLNLTIFNQRIAVQFTLVLILVVGAWHITNSYIQILSDILSRVEIFRINAYLPLLKKRATQFFQLYFIYLLFNSILNLFDVKAPFYKELLIRLSKVQEVGTISFTYGDIISFILILLVTWGLTSIIKIVLDEDNYQKYESIRGIPSAISMTLRILFFSAGLFFAFSAAGFDMTSLSLIISALGVGIGFGLQNVVNNYISGLILIYERPVQKGDTVEVNNLMGDVVDIGIRRSTVRTFDGAEVIIPNSLLTSNQLINWTLSDNRRRLDIRIGVAYGTDPNLVISILKEVAEENQMVVNIPAPVVLFDDFGDSSLNFRLLCWVLFSNGLTARSDIRVSISDMFKKHDIEIPFPQMDLHLKDTPTDKSQSEDKPHQITKKVPKVKKSMKESSRPDEGLEGSDGSDGDD